jgi:hypothetical protein
MDENAISFEEAMNFFNNNKSKSTFAKGGTPFTVNPDWNTLDQHEIFNTDVLLTTAETSINRNGKFSSKLFFVKLDDEIKNVIYTIYKDSVDINATFFLNHTNGDFIDGYKIEGKTTKAFENR